MANSKYEYIRDYEDSTDVKLPRETYIIVRLDGQNFHQFSKDHNFSKPNDKRALDLMIEAAKHVMKEYSKHISLSYGHSDEFSFLLKSKSNLMHRRYCKLTSLVASAFTSYYVYKWNDYFHSREESNPERIDLKYPPSFDARPIVYANRKLVIDYYKWRQVDCHINNLYNTTLNAMCGKYIRHELSNTSRDRLIKTPISQWIDDSKKFMTSAEATQKLSGTLSGDKHDIMFLQYGINYNNELEQFKKGTFIVNESRPDSPLEQNNYFKVMSVDATKSDKFWEQFNLYIFDD